MSKYNKMDNNSKHSIEGNRKTTYTIPAFTVAHEAPMVVVVILKALENCTTFKSWPLLSYLDHPI